MDRGYVKLWRKSINSEVFANESLWRLWSWCLIKTTYRERFVNMSSGKGETSVVINPGQFIFGRNSAAESLNWSPSTAWKRLQKLAEMGCILIESNSQYSVITICNWDEYQTEDSEKELPSDYQVTGKEQPSDSQVTAKEQPSDTNKKVKKVQKVKNKEKDIERKKYGQFMNVLLTDDEKGKLEELFKESSKGKIENLSLYLSSTGKKYSSHYATILSWARRDQEKTPNKKDNNNGFDQRDYQKHATKQSDIPEYLR